MKRKLLILSVSFLMGSIAFACFWDYDTVEMERQQFPSVIELLSGNFLRHSEEFHYWRISDRKLKLREAPDSLPLLDDLAVSYSKTGRDSKAIEIGLSQLELNPNRYETLANLGTFYIHNGDLEKGIQYIDRAIAINPSAHFGREIYQRHLAEYVLSKMRNGKIPLPLSSTFSIHPDAPPHLGELDNFYKFLLNKKIAESSTTEKIYKLEESELEEAVIGVMGMMKFGNSNSPILSEVLGDLLMNGGWEEGARQLAARAYLKASYNAQSEEAKEVYLKRIAFALYHQFTKRGGTQFSIDELEVLFREEMAVGEKFYNTIRLDELGWIALGSNPEVEFAKKYYAEPKLDERIQKGSVKRGGMSRKYLSDTLIGTTVDFRVAHDFSGVSNKEKKELVDSLMESAAAKSKGSATSIEEPDSESNSHWQWIIGAIALIVLGAWTLKRKN